MSRTHGIRGLVVTLALLLVLPLTPGFAARADAARTFGSTPLDDVLYWAGQEKACGLSTNQLAALMLAPTFPETGAPAHSSPSPMTLSRWDYQSALYSFGSPGSYKKAFWHPGVGPWQFDSAGLGADDNAAGRINTYAAAALAAKTMSKRWCDSTGSAYNRRAKVWAPWYGCGSTTCQTIYSQIFNGTSLVNVNAAASVSRTGGMQTRTCTGPGKSGSFTCWRVDPKRAQGYAGFASASFGQAPITAPFYTYTANGREYRHWLRADTGYDIGIWATRPIGKNARTGLTWHSGQPLTDLGSTPPPPPPPPPPGPGGFFDVADGQWFVDGLLWAVDKGVMTGFGDDTFRPDGTLNRAQAVMAVWRAQGQPAAGSDHGFVDVAPTAWFDAGLDWAAEHGIVDGYSDGTFRADKPLNRAQYVMMLWRLAEHPVASSAAAFSDTASDHWYAQGMDWAVQRGYMVGFNDTTFRPNDEMTRAQAVMAFWRGRQFDDVAVTEAYSPAVNWARYRAVVNGFDDHTYRPHDDVNRAQIVMMLWRIAGAPEVATPHGMTDVTGGAWYEPGLRWAKANGVLSGVVSTSFGPDQGSDRAEVAVLLRNLAASPAAWSPAVTPPSTVIF